MTTFTAENTPTTATQPGTPAITIVETEPLLGTPNTSRPVTPRYGSESALESRKRNKKRAFLSRLLSFREGDENTLEETDTAHLATTHALMPVDIVSLPANGGGGQSKGHTAIAEDKTQPIGNESDYLKSKLWYVFPFDCVHLIIESCVGGSDSS